MASAKAHSRQIHFPFVDSCAQSHPKMLGLYAELFDTPWQINPRTVWFCSDQCEEEYCPGSDFRYLYCDACGRQVCEQNPGNGWQVQYRSHPDLGEICLRCYQSEILENGQPRSDFENGSIRGGMFFSYQNPEPKAAGFRIVAGFEDYFIPDAASARKYNSRALKYINAGNCVLTAFERLAIGGLEGFVTMMVKTKKR